MATVFLEIVIYAREAAAVGIESRDEMEDPLDEALSSTGLGEVTGGGGGRGAYNIDIEVPEAQFREALALIRKVLRELRVPANTKITRYEPAKRVFSLYENDE